MYQNFFILPSCGYLPQIYTNSVPIMPGKASNYRFFREEVVFFSDVLPADVASEEFSALFPLPC